MPKPLVYVLGSTPEILITVTDNNGVEVTPTLVRLSIETPAGATITVSGGAMTAGDGYLSYVYAPTTSGWYEYEAWARDADGREASGHHGFWIRDRVE